MGIDESRARSKRAEFGPSTARRDRRPLPSGHRERQLFNQPRSGERLTLSRVFWGRLGWGSSEEAPDVCFLRRFLVLIFLERTSTVGARSPVRPTPAASPARPVCR